MFCKKCGCEINSNDEFCDKCGEKNILELPSKDVYSGLSKQISFVEILKKYKWIAIGIIALALVIVIAISVSNGNQPEKKIVGQWQVSEISQNENLSDYPEGYFCFFEDGQMVSDGISGVYFFQGDTLVLQYNSMWIGSIAYKYSIHGDTLELKNVERDESQPAICYEKVK